MTSPLKNDTFLRALLRQPVEYTPIWMMRQAGRYLPEYRTVRAEAGDFLSLCRNTDFAIEVTLQPLRRFNLDAAILFSDILTVPDAMGLGLYFAEGEGPKFRKPLQHEADIAALAVPDMDRLRYVFDAVAAIRRALDGQVPLIGFSGSPFTLACYMVEGSGSRDFHTVKTMLYRRPELLHRILDTNARAVTEYLNAQIRAGAQAVQIFDSWGGILAHDAFQTFSLRYMRQIVDGLIREHEGRRGRGRRGRPEERPRHRSRRPRGRLRGHQTARHRRGRDPGGHRPPSVRLVPQTALTRPRRGPLQHAPTWPDGSRGGRPGRVPPRAQNRIQVQFVAPLWL